MCQHTKFDANRWAPCAVCLKAKRVANTLKNKAYLLNEIANLIKEAEAIEITGRKARFEREEIASYQKLLDEAA